MRALLTCLLLSACADQIDPIGSEVEVGPEGDGKADADSELSVRTGDTTLWVRKTLDRRTTDGNALFVLRGRTSRNVTDGLGFINDDPYGDFASRGARGFEVSWPVSQARTLADGVDQFVRLSFAPSHGRPDSLTARAIVRPRFTSFTGPSSIYVTAELTPVVVGGLVVYRAQGHTSAANTALVATAGTTPLHVRRIDGTRFEIDLEPEVAFASVGVGSIDIAATFASSTTVKRAQLGLAIKKLALTADDVYEKFPRPTCTSSTRSCLVGLPDGALDLGGCGEAVVVLSCRGSLGVSVDAPALQLAHTRGAQLTTAPAFHTDATGLVGADRADQLATAATQQLDERVDQLAGLWYLSATARDGALTSAVDDAVLAAYAHPLDLVAAHAPVPGNAVATRQVAADALLLDLAKFDFLHSEFGRTYETLVGEFRDRHVASIRDFRETVAIEPHPGFPDRDVLVGHWLDAYVEVSIVRATGAAANTVIEID